MMLSRKELLFLGQHFASGRSLGLRDWQENRE
jgi:hypothetical protein